MMFVRLTASSTSCSVRSDLELRLLPALHENSRDSVESIQNRLEIVRRDFPELCLRHRIRSQAIADDRKTRKIEPMRFDSRRSREATLYATQRGIYLLELLNHVYAPVERQIPLR